MGNKSLKIGKYPKTIDTDAKNLMVSFLLLAAPVKEIVCDWNNPLITKGKNTKIISMMEE